MFTDKGGPEPALIVPVRGRFTPAIEFSPEVIVLPWVTGEGEQLKMNCLARSPDGKRFTLAPSGVPDGLSIRIDAADGERRAATILTVEWRRDSDRSPGPIIGKTLRLVANFDDGEVELELPVKCRREK